MKRATFALLRIYSKTLLHFILLNIDIFAFCKRLKFNGFQYKLTKHTKNNWFSLWPLSSNITTLQYVITLQNILICQKLHINIPESISYNFLMLYLIIIFTKHISLALKHDNTTLKKSQEKKFPSWLMNINKSCNINLFSNKFWMFWN